MLPFVRNFGNFWFNIIGYECLVN
uniref:Uncharacterized protein n=1 Tax=Rhizophora mucronata TaxID=61149 RepID=A0A2P2QQL0_RHIMU